jgi:isopenicillin N synthase-like dioxygenase
MQNQKELIVDLEPYIDGSVEGTKHACRRLVNILHNQSFVIVYDPRVTSDDNNRYLDMMERYFSQPEEVLRKDERPEVYYQVGVSKGQEKPRDHRAYISTMPVDHWPHITPLDYSGDPRWRFFRNLGLPPPYETGFPKLNAQHTPVIPIGFEAEWAKTMDTWGNKMLTSVYTIAGMIAEGLNLPRTTFTGTFAYAPHLIAPNGVNLLEYPESTVFNGFHYDLNWGTIHGRSRFPGLRAWPRSGAPFTVRVPKGALLFQVAKQLEWQTGGYFRAGFHEVVNLPETVKTAQEAVRAGRPPIRVSSTVFAHVASDVNLHVVEKILDLPADEYAKILQMYPTTKAGDQVLDELKAIGLKKD